MRTTILYTLLLACGMGTVHLNAQIITEQWRALYDRQTEHEILSKLLIDHQQRPSIALVSAPTYDAVYLNSTILQYSPDGTLNWESNYAPTDSMQNVANDAAIDNENHIISGGTHDYWGNESCYVRKNDESGSLDWTRIYDEGGITQRVARLTAIGSDIYTFGCPYGNEIRKYDADGDAKWTVSAPFLGAFRKVFVHDSTYYASMQFHINAQTWYYGVVKYQDSTLLWQQSQESTLSTMNVDEDGNVVVASLTYIDTSQTTNNALYIAKYAAQDGQLLWEYIEPYNGWLTMALAFDEQNNVLVSNDENNAFLRKISPNGTLLWSVEPPEGYESSWDFQDLLADNAGRVYWLIRDRLFVYSPDGVLLHTHFFTVASPNAETHMQQILFDTTGALYVAGMANYENDVDSLLLVKLSTPETVGFAEANAGILPTTLALHPNPASLGSGVEVLLPPQSGLLLEASINDLQGRTLLPSPLHRDNALLFDLRSLVLGMYFVRVRTERGVFTSKLLVQH